MGAANKLSQKKMIWRFRKWWTVKYCWDGEALSGRKEADIEEKNTSKYIKKKVLNQVGMIKKSRWNCRR